MWIIAPTPETRTTIVLLNVSSVSPSGTLRAPPISIQVNSGAEMPGCTKTTQPQTKLTSTAATEMKLLTAFHRSANSVMTTALTSGASRTTHGKIEFIGFARSKLELADVFDVCGLPGPIEGNKDRKPNGDLSRCDGDNKEDEDLAVVIGQPIR